MGCVDADAGPVGCALKAAAAVAVAVGCALAN